MSEPRAEPEHDDDHATDQDREDSTAEHPVGEKQAADNAENELPG
jgi:hypothetical protein